MKKEKKTDIIQKEKNTDALHEKETVDSKKKKTDRQKEKNRLTNKEQTAKREHRGIIFASLYTIMKNKMGDIFLLGQNQCHITEVKKSYFCHTFHLRPKKVFWWVVVVVLVVVVGEK